MKRFFLFALAATVFAACSTATLEMPIPSNEIWYTSSNGNVIEPYSGYFNSNATAMQTFGANITSNTYENGVGVITFDGDVTTIGDYAFYSCTALTSVTIGNSVTTIGEEVFNGCDALKEVYCKPTTPPSLGYSYVFDGNASGRRIYVPTASVDAYKAADGWKEYADAIVAMPIPSNQIWYTSSNGKIVKPYATDVFEVNITSNIYKNGVGVITFDGDVTMIGDWAFYKCDALTSVTIPNSVTTIGSFAFRDCDALTSVTIPNSETMIGIYAFRNCDALTSVTIPDSVTAIGEYAFRGCNALKEVYCHSTTPPIAIRIDPKWSAFNGNASGRKIYVPTASVDAYKAADGWREYADAIEPYNFTE